MNIKLPKPDSHFRKKAARLGDMLKQGMPKDRRAAFDYSAEKELLAQELRRKFQSAFGLSSDRLKLAERFCRRFHHTVLGPEHSPEGGAHFGLFDHLTFYQRNGNLVIVSQPYGIDVPRLKAWTEMVGASHVVASDWCHYYPGRAKLFFVEFTRAAKANLDKSLRAL